MSSTETNGRIDNEVHPPTVLDLKILTCAKEAGISATQWRYIMKAVGAEKIADILELHLEHFNRCNFKPLLSKRIVNFLDCLWSQLTTLRLHFSQAATVAPPPPPQCPPPPTVQQDAPSPVPKAAPWPLRTSRLCPQHQPFKKRREDLNYWFFHAVSHGCKECVKILVEEMGVDKNATSATQEYSAIDFAEYFAQPEMKAYLEKL